MTGLGAVLEKGRLIAWTFSIEQAFGELCFEAVFKGGLAVLLAGLDKRFKHFRREIPCGEGGGQRWAEQICQEQGRKEQSHKEHEG